MKSELIVDVNHEEVSIALLEDSRLVSLQKESRNIAYAVGDLYMAKVKKIMPGLNAAFLDVGYDKDAFLHYLDLGPQFSTYSKFLEEAMADKKKVPAISRFKPEPDIPKQGTIQDVVKPGQVLLVQIAKEPISSKGPRLTTEISFTGRYMVLMPFGNKISVSQKIKSTEEKIRLRQLVGSIKPKGFSVIVRTSAENKKVAELNNEMRTLVKCWEDSIAKMQRSQTPSLIYEEDSRTVSVIRDMFSPNFENIYVNESETFTQIQNYVALIAPENKDIVKLYAKDTPIFDNFNITRQINKEREMLAHDLCRKRNRRRRGNTSVRPDFKRQLIIVGNLPDTGVFDVVIYLYNRRMCGIYGNKSNRRRRGLISVRRDIASAHTYGYFHIKTGFFAKCSNMHIRVKNLNIGIRLDIRRSNFAFVVHFDISEL